MVKILCETAKKINPFGGSRREEWETPQWLFDILDQEFHFTLDVCATQANTKCKRFFTREEDGLKQSWKEEICWMNPPYHDVPIWLEKAWNETRNKNTVVVALLPSRTNTRWFRKYYRNVEIRLLANRIAFLDSNKIVRKANPKPAMIFVFKLDILPKIFVWEIEGR